MMKCITLEYADGSVAVRGGFGPQFLARFTNYDAALQYVFDNLVSVQNPGTIARIEDIAFPTDRNFRAAWKRGGGKIEIDMPKARGIHMDRIRKVRNQELERADNDLKTAEDNNDATEGARVRAKRKKLRDIPQTFDLSGATTPTELHALWPLDLPR